MLKKIPNPYVRSLCEWLLAVAAAVLIFLVVRSFVFRFAHVSGNSMEPTLNHGDTVVLSRVHYLFGEPKKGDIVAFPYKENPSEYYIKRVIGVPGDVIDLTDYRFTVNGVPLSDEFSSEAVLALGDVRFPLTVEDGRYFVLGDNRNGSKDSRYAAVGCVPKGQMVGKVVLRVWPHTAFGGVK